MRLLRCAAVLVILHLAAASAYCDQAGKEAKVEEFFRLAKMDETLRHTLDLVAAQMKSGAIQQIMGAKTSPDVKKSMDEMQDKLMVILSDAISWDKIKPDYVKLYADAYTEDELDGIVAFYKSPAGQAMVANTPVMMNKANVLVEERLKAAAPQIQKLILDYTSRTAPPKQ